MFSAVRLVQTRWDCRNAFKARRYTMHIPDAGLYSIPLDTAIYRPPSLLAEMELVYILPLWPQTTGLKVSLIDPLLASSVK